MVFLIKKSVAKEILKSLGKNKLEELKREVIEILKKQDEKEYKKALSHFENEEKNMSYLEKSISGEWIEKAGYGIGTVRVWKGKKYKKIAPGKWRRIYETDSRGAKQSIAIIKKKILNVKSTDELLELIMQNMNRFTGTDGKLLPIVEELKNAVNESKSKLNTSKTTFNNISDISKERENLITSIIKFPNQGVLKGNNKSIQNYFKLFIGDKLVQKEYKTVLRKILNKDVTTENVIERVSEFLISKGIPNKKVVNAANYIEKRIDLFKNYHKEYNKRDTSKNILNKARNFDDYEI